MIIAIDFDGTIVNHGFPKIGEPVPHAFRVMKAMQRAGHKLILYTMRSDGRKHGDVLAQAVKYCKSYGVEFWGVNENPQQKEWTDSPKVYANIYIDDAAFGSPNIVNSPTVRPFVNWLMVEATLIQDGELPMMDDYLD